MTNSRSEQKEVISVSVRKFFEVAHWATKRQTQLFIRGTAPPRDGPIEKVLLRMEKRKMLRVVQNKVTDPKYYSLPRKTKNFNPLDAVRLYHGLSCTECLVRFYRANLDCEVIPERDFRNLGSVPEVGFLYPNGSLLAVEFSTKHDVSYPLNMIGKFQAYDRNRERINDKFQARTGVVFIWDIPRLSVAERIARWKPAGPYWFIDWATFLEIPLGEALTAPLYFRPDGRTEAIRK